MASGALEGRMWPRGRLFALAPVAEVARFVLRGDAGVASAAGAAFGVALPRRLGPAGEEGGRAALWLGPDEWLLLAEDGAAGTAVAAALAGMPHSLVEISARQVGLEVEGTLAALALNAGCPLDLDASAFPVGMATRTILAKAEIVLWRRGPMRFRLEVARSFALYVVDFLTEGARRAPRG